MKYIAVQFPDTADTSALNVGTTVKVGEVDGGTVIMRAEEEVFDGKQIINSSTLKPTHVHPAVIGPSV